MDENQSSDVVVESPHKELFDFLASTIVNFYMQVEPVTSSESWGTWEQSDKETFREQMDLLASVTTAIRHEFDQPIWKGRITGVEPIRAKSSRGADTAVLTTEQKLAKLKGK